MAWCALRPGRKPARFRESGIEDRHEHLGDGLLDDPVHDGRDAQQPLAAVVLGDFNPADGLWAVAPGFELAADGLPVRAQVGGKSSMAMPSMPGAPWLAFTRFHALRRLSLVRTVASNSVVATSFVSSWFKARFGLVAGLPSPSGDVAASPRSLRLLLVFRCLVLRRPQPARLL